MFTFSKLVFIFSRYVNMFNTGLLEHIVTVVLVFKGITPIYIPIVHLDSLFFTLSPAFIICRIFEDEIRSVEHHFICHLPFVCLLWPSLMAQMLKNLPTMQDSWIWSLGWEDSLEKEKATHPSILAWRIPRTWWATVLEVKKSWTWLSDFHSLYGEISISFFSIILFYFIELYELFVYFAN